MKWKLRWDQLPTDDEQSKASEQLSQVCHQVHQNQQLWREKRGEVAESAQIAQFTPCSFVLWASNLIISESGKSRCSIALSPPAALYYLGRHPDWHHFLLDVRKGRAESPRLPIWVSVFPLISRSVTALCMGCSAGLIWDTPVSDGKRIQLIPGCPCTSSCVPCHIPARSGLTRRGLQGLGAQAAHTRSPFTVNVLSPCAHKLLGLITEGA